MKRMRGGVLVKAVLALLLLLVLGAGTWAGLTWLDYSRFVRTPLAVQGQDPHLDISHGTSFKHIVGMLEARKLSDAPGWYWRLLAERMHVVKKLDAGEYELKPGMTPRDLLHAMATGDVVRYRFTLVDGWTFKQLRAALDQAPHLRHDSRDLDAAGIMRKLGAAGQNPEGWFLPETYEYTKGASDLSLLKRMWEAMHEALHKQWPGRASDLPLKTPYQALILASLVEKETARGDERPRIAGVFVRRLERGMRLQTDPTVIYGMGDQYRGDITWKALRTDTPYNTYVHAGLPPTPIAMPGLPALHAALHPAKGDALYFVARGDGSGRHIFSSTLAEHNRAVACSQLKRCP